MGPVCPAETSAVCTEAIRALMMLVFAAAPPSSLLNPFQVQAGGGGRGQRRDLRLFGGRDRRLPQVEEDHRGVRTGLWIDAGDVEVAGAADRPGAGALLHDVGEFVGQEMGVGTVLAQHDVRADSVGPGRDRLRRSTGRRVVVQAHVAEIDAEPGFEEGAVGGVQRASRRAQDIAHDRRRLALGGGGADRLAAHRLVLILAGGALSAELDRRRCGLRGRRGHPHHSIGDGVRFAFQRVVDRADLQLGLQARGRGRQPAQPRLVAPLAGGPCPAALSSRLRRARGRLGLRIFRRLERQRLHGLQPPKPLGLLGDRAYRTRLWEGCPDCVWTVARPPHSPPKPPRPRRGAIGPASPEIRPG